MKISGICFTQSGRKLAERVNALLLNDTWDELITTEWYCKGRRFQKDGSMFDLVTESMHEWSGRRFMDSDVIIFIGATGIAVRGIAPHVRDKRYDPAVIVIDEQGKFCIALLSGHIGGANDMVRRISAKLGSVPVITTATDVNDLFAVDEFATKNDMTISSMTYAKEVSAALLSGDPVGFWTNFQVDIDFEKEPLGTGKDGKNVYLRDIWPSTEEIAQVNDAWYYHYVKLLIEI